MITEPLTITWRMDDFEAVGLDGSSDPGRGIFAVFVDRSPMPVGKDVRWLGRNDDSCQRDLRCPDARYLADRQVYLTTTPTVTIESLPRVGQGVGDERHHVNVVVLDGTGTRRTESAWYLQFRRERRVSAAS